MNKIKKRFVISALGDGRRRFPSSQVRKRNVMKIASG